MTYAVETHDGTNNIKQLMWTTEMSFLRTILGKARRDNVRNENVKEECGIEDVLRFVKRRSVL